MLITNLRQERIRRGLTLEQVAQTIGITNQSVSLLETGQNKPSYDILVKLEDLFQKPYRWLFSVADGNETLSPQ